MKQYAKLGQLTALRFVAAAMVVMCHMQGAFGFTVGPRLDCLAAGVSFFFVLSGFILAYVYPELRTRGEIAGFLRARVARVWPGHVATFLLAMWLLDLPWHATTALPNLMLVQAWNPLAPGTFYYSYNSPSWSLSTELFFYLAFPFLISSWDRKCLPRILLSAAVLATIIVYVNWKDIADGGPSFLYVNPAARIFEFVFGMLLQHFWKRCRRRLDWSVGPATVFEIGAIGCCALSVFLAPGVARHLDSAWTGPAFSAWLYSSGSMFAFGLMIFVMAVGRGAVSRFLARPWCVVLGEMSFAVYLLHQIFLRYHQANIARLPHGSDAAEFLLFWVILLASSYTMWTCVEKPARRAILRSWSKK